MTAAPVASATNVLSYTFVPGEPRVLTPITGGKKTSDPAKPFRQAVGLEYMNLITAPDSLVIRLPKSTPTEVVGGILEGRTFAREIPVEIHLIGQDGTVVSTVRGNPLH